MAELNLRNLTRAYGKLTVVDGIDLDVQEGQLLTLLGPSGCGKSTTLAMIAGLDTPTSGKISVGGEVVFDSATGVSIEAERRNLGMVFQTYALWPHMTVAQNVGYPLKLRRMGASERRKRIGEALDLVEMGAFADRYPNQLSGGQQQRVALARTLAYRPRILLLDEPLSNLDAKLRDKARTWLKVLQGQLGITTILVTHDQEEALSLSDRIAVMQGGKIVQLGSPSEIYDGPTNPYVADFVGSSNFLPGVLQRVADQRAEVMLDNGAVLRVQRRPGAEVGDRVQVTCRPERIVLLDAADQIDTNVIHAKLADRSYVGSHSVLTLRSEGIDFRVDAKDATDRGNFSAWLPEEHCFMFPDKGTSNDAAA
ncbi:ABC transporter ATP-binding protein [Cereibacter sp. SYSU M97828]|nr:ABC transporter ATP-binding protein [Cereibacter flavus]